MIYQIISIFQATYKKRRKNEFRSEKLLKTGQILGFIYIGCRILSGKRKSSEKKSQFHYFLV